MNTYVQRHSEYSVDKKESRHRHPTSENICSLRRYWVSIPTFVQFGTTSPFTLGSFVHGLGILAGGDLLLSSYHFQCTLK